MGNIADMVAGPASEVAPPPSVGPDRSWLTWPEAAALVGCPVPTVEYYARTGRIERRPQRRGREPSLSRASVEEFAAWWRTESARRREAQDRRAQDRERRAAEQSGPPEPAGWVDTATAAQMLGCSESHVPWLARHGRIDGRKVAGRWWYAEASVRAHIDERSQWMSEVDAARLVGVSTRTIQAAVRDGRIDQRKVHRTQASLSLDSVLRFAEKRWAQAHRKQQARDRREAERRDRLGPPQDAHQWVTTAAAAELLGVRETQVRRLAAQGWFVSDKRGHRRWYRRDQVERIARALDASR